MSEQTTSQTDFYSLLGVSRDASLQEIKQQYRKLSLLYHPDKKNGNEAKFAQINLAFKVLSNEKKRKKYDAALSSTFDELVQTERELGYKQNHDFIKANGEFDIDKFDQLFCNQNQTLDRDFKASDAKLDELIYSRLSERDQLEREVNERFIENVAHLRGKDFNEQFNNIFETLKSQNTGLIESAEAPDQVLEPHEAEQTSLMTIGQQLDLSVTNEGDQLNKLIKNNRFDQNAISSQKPQKISEEEINQLVTQYQQTSKDLANLTEQDFIVNTNDDLLSALEIDNK